MRDWFATGIRLTLAIVLCFGWLFLVTFLFWDGQWAHAVALVFLGVAGNFLANEVQR